MLISEPTIGSADWLFDGENTKELETTGLARRLALA